MCTIGAIHNFRNHHRYFFKNVDQTDSCKYPKPFFKTGKHFKYLKMASNMQPEQNGVLAGVNEAGLVVLGADGNCMPNYSGKKYSSLNESLVIYERLLSECRSTWEAIGFVMKAYQDLQLGGNGDILMIGDRSEAVAMEYTVDRWGIQFQSDNPYLIRSNFFILMNHLRPIPEESTLHTSSAMRYADALSHLSIKGSENTLDDVFALVRNHTHGENAMSICRHGGAGEYFTQASIVVDLSPRNIDAYILLNQKPCQGDFERFTF